MALLTSMRQQAIDNSNMGTLTTMLWQEIEDVIIEVWAGATVEYVAKAGDEIFITEDINEFNEVLVYAFS